MALVSILKKTSHRARPIVLTSPALYGAASRSYAAKTDPRPRTKLLESRKQAGSVQTQGHTTAKVAIPSTAGRTSCTNGCTQPPSNSMISIPSSWLAPKPGHTSSPLLPEFGKKGHQASRPCCQVLRSPAGSSQSFHEFQSEDHCCQRQCIPGRRSASLTNATTTSSYSAKFAVD